MSRAASPGSAVVFGAVERRPAEHGAGVLEVAIAPAVGGDHVEDVEAHALGRLDAGLQHPHDVADRKSTRLNSSHLVISYAVFCLKKKKTHSGRPQTPPHPQHRQIS